MDKSYFEFVSVEDFKKLAVAIEVSELDKPIHELKLLLENGETLEKKYHSFLMTYPWILGLQYEKIQSLSKLDDENIPDLTGVRAHDGYRDIIEIKQPYIDLFRKDGEFTSEFNDAWNQVERYLNFAREEKDYLRRKGYNFDNPKCYLIIGYNLANEELLKIKRKEKMNTSIQILTYNDLLVFAKKTIQFMKQMKKRDQ